MATHATPTELRKMSAEELQREIDEKRPAAKKLHILILAGTEKDTAKLRKERVQIARMLTVLGELKGKDTTSKLASPSKKAKPARRSSKSADGATSSTK